MAKINEIEHLDDAEAKTEPVAEKSDPNFGFSGHRADVYKRSRKRRPHCMHESRPLACALMCDASSEPCDLFVEVQSIGPRLTR